jgi:anti-sigma-K factor RskA
MNEHDEHEMSHHDCGQDAAAYVLGALEPAEASAFRLHLDSCVVCRDEVSAFGAVVDVLPLAAPPQSAPRSLKRRVMSEVRAAESASERRSPRRRAARNRFARVPRPLLLSAPGALAVALVALAVALSAGGGSGIRVIQASTSWQGTHATLRVSDGHGELVVSAMPSPPAGKTYELWLARPGKPPMPTNVLFTVTASGAASVDVPGDLRGVRQVMVTPEPAGGSRVPTHPPVVVANL